MPYFWPSARGRPKNLEKYVIHRLFHTLCETVSRDYRVRVEGLAGKMSSLARETYPQIGYSTEPAPIIR